MERNIFKPYYINIKQYNLTFFKIRLSATFRYYNNVTHDAPTFANNNQKDARNKFWKISHKVAWKTCTYKTPNTNV